MYYRIFILIALILTGCGAVFAEQIPWYADDAAMQRKMLQTGFRILNSNNIHKHVFFYYDKRPKVQVRQYFYSKKIVFYKGVLRVIENDDEFAALIAREIAYSMDARFGIFRRTSMGYNPRKYELKADRKAVDYLVRAGYNPIGLITIYNKLLSEPSAFCESFLIKHKGSERILSVYDYIYQKYPYFIAHNEYLKTPVYQNFLKTSKKERKKIRTIQQARMNIRHRHDKGRIYNDSILDFDMYNIYMPVDFDNCSKSELLELEEYINHAGGAKK